MARSCLTVAPESLAPQADAELGALLYHHRAQGHHSRLLVVDDDATPAAIAANLTREYALEPFDHLNLVQCPYALADYSPDGHAARPMPDLGVYLRDLPARVGLGLFDTVGLGATYGTTDIELLRVALRRAIAPRAYPDTALLSIARADVDTGMALLNAQALVPEAAITAGYGDGGALWLERQLAGPGWGIVQCVGLPAWGPYEPTVAASGGMPCDAYTVYVSYIAEYPSHSFLRLLACHPTRGPRMVVYGMDDLRGLANGASIGECGLQWEAAKAGVYVAPRFGDSMACWKEQIVTEKTSTAVWVAPTTGAPGQGVTLQAVLRDMAGNRLEGLPLSFRVAGQSVGTATTKDYGYAALPYTIPADAATCPVTVQFTGNDTYAASEGRGTLAVVTPTPPPAPPTKADLLTAVEALKAQADRLAVMIGQL